MKSFFGYLFAAVACMAAVGSSVHGQSLSIDNFEGYTNGQPIATSASSTPWLRFGAVQDNLFATTSSSQDPSGTLGAQIPVNPAATTGFAIIARNYGTAANFSTYSQATVLSKSKATTTGASLQLFFSDGSTTYVSTVAQAETTTSTNYTFPLTASAFTRTGGSDSFATAISGLTEIGFQTSSSTGTSETLAFDDFAVSTPEPSSAALLILGIGAVTLQRRRRSQPESAGC